MNLLSQIIGIIGFCFWIYSIQSKEKKNILKLQSIANIFYAFQYFALGLIPTGCMNIITTIKGVVYYKNAKKRKENSIWMLLIFFSIIIFIGIITFNGYLSLIPIIITLAYTYTTWQKNITVLRWTFIIAACIWIYYNITVGAYSALIGNFFEIISGIVSIIRFDLKRIDNKDK